MNKTVIRIPPSPLYDMEAMESWLTDMAREGLYLERQGIDWGLGHFYLMYTDRLFWCSVSVSFLRFFPSVYPFVKCGSICSQGMITHAYLSLLGTVSEPFAIHSKKAILLTLISLPLRNAGKPGVCTSS